MIKKSIVLFLILVAHFQLSSAQFGKVIQCTGSVNYLQVTHFAVPAQFSVSAWIKTRQTSVGTIVAWKGVVGDGDAVIVRINGGKLSYGEYIAGSWKEYQTTTSVNSGNWTHIVVARMNGSVKLYINGLLSSTQTTLKTTALCTTNTLSIASLQIDAAGTPKVAESYEGLIDELGIWNRELLATEIASLGSSPLNASQSNLLTYFNFDSNSADQTTPSENAIIKGAVNYVDPSTTLPYRGMYFAKTIYTSEALPVFTTVKSQLPTPILDANQGWIDLYWKAWSLGISHIRKPQSNSPFVSNWYDEAFDNNIYQWDIIFMTMFGRYGHHVFPAINSLDNFYCLQDPDGYLCRIIDEATGSYYPAPNGKWTDYMVNPPLFSWAEMESFRITGDRNRLALVLPVLEKYFEWVEKYRKADGTPHLLYWNTGLGSGMDNTPRPYSNKHGWVDMSCQMVIQCDNLAAICAELGYTDKAVYFQSKAAEIGAQINKWMWNEADGLYYDVDAQGNQIKWKTAACFWPMLAGIASQSQTAKMIANLQNPVTFWRPMIFPTLAANQPNYMPNGYYWRGGVWAPTNYAIIKGLQRTNNNAFARIATEKYIAGLYDVYKQTGTLWENYAPELIAGKLTYGTNDSNTGACRTDFVGWTGLGPISLLIEDVIGIRANGIAKTISWYLDRKDRNGLLNLHFGNIVTSLECAARTDSAATAYLTVTSDNPYTLIAYKAGKEKVFQVKAGVNNFVFENESSNVGLSAVISFEIRNNAALQQLNLKLQNPKMQRLRISVCSIDGKEQLLSSNKIHEAGTIMEIIKTSSFQKGIYLLKIQTNTDSVVRKFVLN